MPDQVQQSHSKPEIEKSVQRESIESPETAGEIEADAQHQKYLHGGSFPCPGKNNALLSRLNKVQRAEAVTRMQHMHGNTYVQQQVQRVGLVVQRDGDHDVDTPPPAPSFQPSKGQFGVMGKAAHENATGNPGDIPSPDGEFAGSQANLTAFANNAQSSNTYHAMRAPEKAGEGAISAITTGLKNFVLKDELAGLMAAKDLEDMKWALDTQADVGRAQLSTSSWLSLVNTSSKSWASLVERAKSLSIEVTHKAPEGLQKLDPDFVGHQQISKSDVGGYGDELATMARQAGVTRGPDTSHYQTAMSNYQHTRDVSANSSRGVVSLLINERAQAIQKKQEAAEDEKGKWETYKLALDALATGVSLALGGELGEVKQTATVSEEGKMVGAPEAPSPKQIGDAASKGLAKILDAKIKQIDTQITAYKSQEKSLQDVIKTQLDMKAIDDYKTALGDQKTKAEELEQEETEMNRKLIQFADEIDKQLQAKGKEPKGTTNAAEAATLLVDIRSCRVQTQGAVEASITGTAGVSTIYAQIAAKISARSSSQAGRSDARAALFALEGTRWAQGVSSVNVVWQVLQERVGQVTELESSFMSTFLSTASPSSVPLVGPNY